VALEPAARIELDRDEIMFGQQRPAIITLTRRRLRRLLEPGVLVAAIGVVVLALHAELDRTVGVTTIEVISQHGDDLPSHDFSLPPRAVQSRAVHPSVPTIIGMAVLRHRAY
jgi:hypothetical protein